MPGNTPPESSNHGTSKSRAQAKRGSSTSKRFRLERLTLKNFKAFDNLTIEFPRPNLADDPDILVMGSKNGLGKTSILEACSLLFLAAIGGEKTLEYISYPRITVDLLDIMIRAGSQTSRISGTFTIDDKPFDISLTLSRDGKTSIKKPSTDLQQILQRTRTPRSANLSTTTLRFFLSLAGLNSEPLLAPPFMYFHSYRKVQEGRLELGAMVEGEQILARSRFASERETSISLFKLEILRLLMSRGALFEDLDNEDDAEGILNNLNTLMERYAGEIEFRVTPINKTTTSFNFDGLSSGQKEIISTLFLIWYYTRSQRGIILIDEPELHLNPEWHRGFIWHLLKLSPHNQYITATHSEDVFSAVDKDRRIILAADVEEVP